MGCFSHEFTSHISLNSQDVNGDFEPRFCGTFVLVADTTRKTCETAKPFRGFSRRPSIKNERQANACRSFLGDLNPGFDRRADCTPPLVSKRSKPIVCALRKLRAFKAISRAKQKTLSQRLRVFCLVRGRGLEPPRHLTHAPQTCLSADSSTLAYNAFHYSIPLPLCQSLFPLPMDKNFTKWVDKSSSITHNIIVYV